MKTQLKYGAQYPCTFLVLVINIVKREENFYSEATKHEIHKCTYNIITVQGDNHITNKKYKLHSKWDLFVSLHGIFLCP